MTSFSASTTTTKKITTPAITTPAPLSAETCEGTVDFKMRKGKAKIIRSGEISKTLRLTQSKEPFEIQILNLIKKLFHYALTMQHCLMLVTNSQRRFSNVVDKVSKQT